MFQLHSVSHISPAIRNNEEKRIHTAGKMKGFSEARNQAQQALEQKGQSKMAAERKKKKTRERKEEQERKMKERGQTKIKKQR